MEKGPRSRVDPAYVHTTMSRSPVQLILLGPPGAGKGTQAARLTRRLGLVHINPGRILREEAARDSPLGREVRDRMGHGQLVDDGLVDRLVRERLEALTPGQGFVLDGYPRTAAQAQALRATLARLHRLRRPPVVVWLQASPEVLTRRLRDRAGDEHRPDDTERAIDCRLQVDRENARSLRDALAGWTNVLDVRADQPPDVITEEILGALRSRRRRRTTYWAEHD
jgi:adenylate kinase